MEQKYWLSRKRAAGAMARRATSAEARLIHLELAGRYSIRAAYADPAPLFADSPDLRAGEERGAPAQNKAVRDPSR